MDEVTALCATAARFVRRELGPHLRGLDLQPAAPPPVALARALAPLGLPGLGGAGDALGPGALVRLTFALGNECAGVAAYAAHAMAGAWLAARAGVAVPEGPVAVALHEARELSTAGGLDVAARVAADRVTADKLAVPLLHDAAAVALLARQGRELVLAWVVPGPGVTAGPPLGLLGVRALPVADLRCDGAPLLACSPLDEETFGALLALLALLAAAAAAGTAQAAVAAARAYAAERYQGGVMIDRHDAVRLLLSRGEAGVAAARAAVEGAADRLEGGDPGAWRAALHATVATARPLVTAALDAVQALGGYGYMRDYGLEQRLRDAVALALLPLDRTRLALLGDGPLPRLVEEG